MDEVVATSIGEPRSRALLLSGFAIIAVISASIGIYGVMTYGVGSRMLGLRAALGADPGVLTRLVLRQAGIVAATAIIGLIGAGALLRLARSLPYGVGAIDVATSTLPALLLFGVTLGAAYVPARRAARVDPTTVLLKSSRSRPARPLLPIRSVHMRVTIDHLRAACAQAPNDDRAACDYASALWARGENRA